MSVVVLLADGARPDVLRDAIAAGRLPAMARLVDAGAMYEATTVFPSVTGPAYTPFLLGRYPGPLGLPGLRWYDRAREVCSFPHYTRSYLSADMRKIDRDIDGAARSVFQLVPSRLGSLCMFPRGLGRGEQIGGGARFALRAARTHLRGDVRGWLAIDRWLGDEVVRHVARERPAYTFAAFTGVDKTSHEEGHGSARVTEALTIVDDVVARVRDDAERAGRWDETHLWIVSDHGHSEVREHDDLAEVIRALGHRAIGHPWVYGGWDVAVMVSGNAMAHLYLEQGRRARPWWPALRARWEPLCEALLARPSVDLLILPHGPDRCEIRAAGARGAAMVERRGACVAYRPATGDPLDIGETGPLAPDDAWEFCAGSDYPDALVQLASLAGSARAGEVIVSAARGYDFRARYEPIPHRSAHGALHREHMTVPVLTSRPLRGAPRRTVDLMPTALAALGIAPPPGLDGRAML